MDMDTTSGKNSHEKILRDFCDNNINIMVGTQMIAKGHDFPNVTLVGVIAADSLLNIGDYRASERTFQLITQVAGRAGRDELPGRVIIQTYNTDDFSIRAASNHDFHSFYDQEIMIREKLNYPPFTNIASLIISGINEKQVSITAGRIKKALVYKFSTSKVQAEVLGPARAPIFKIMNKYRWRIIVKCKDIEKMIKVLTLLSDQYYSKKARNSVELGIDINPVNML
jgi:primosomal protein N' (replication factor Y)